MMILAKERTHISLILNPLIGMNYGGGTNEHSDCRVRLASDNQDKPENLKKRQTEVPSRTRALRIRQRSDGCLSQVRAARNQVCRIYNGGTMKGARQHKAGAVGGCAMGHEWDPKNRGVRGHI
jgi:hypothetical protein